MLNISGMPKMLVGLLRGMLGAPLMRGLYGGVGG
jgi:hypothetical protein